MRGALPALSALTNWLSTAARSVIRPLRSPPPPGGGLEVPSSIFCFTNLPDSVSAESGHPPLLPAPGTSAEAVSCLSNKDQLAQLMLFWSRKLSQVCDSLRSRPPFPEASQEPHSVTKSGRPLEMA